MSQPDVQTEPALVPPPEQPSSKKKAKKAKEKVKKVAAPVRVNKPTLPVWGYMLIVLDVLMLIALIIIMVNRLLISKDMVGLVDDSTPTAVATPTPRLQPTVTKVTTGSPVALETARATTLATATPKPTADTTATAAVIAQFTAVVKATADAKATIAALNKPISLTGSGSKVIKDLKLNAGVARLTMDYKGQGNFIVTLLSAEGNTIDLPVNTIGNYQGSQYIPISQSGSYVLEIKATDSWKIDVEGIQLVLQGAADSPKLGTYNGRGDKAIVMHIPNSGLATFKMTHKGKTNFIVSILSPQNGSAIALLVNAIGNYTGEKAEKVDSGDFLVNIKADGDWTIELS
ncbi:MAG: hypothetical protein HXX20_18345 [Chloroflexi bacterium]|nr:hypothetical protein [Chloroflexota bacterium]